MADDGAPFLGTRLRSAGSRVLGKGKGWGKKRGQASSSTFVPLSYSSSRGNKAPRIQLGLNDLMDEEDKLHEVMKSQARAAGVRKRVLGGESVGQAGNGLDRTDARGAHGVGYTADGTSASGDDPLVLLRRHQGPSLPAGLVRESATGGGSAAIELPAGTPLAPPAPAGYVPRHVFAADGAVAGSCARNEVRPSAPQLVVERASGEHAPFAAQPAVQARYEAWRAGGEAAVTFPPSYTRHDIRHELAQFVGAESFFTPLAMPVASRFARASGPGDAAPARGGTRRGRRIETWTPHPLLLKRCGFPRDKDAPRMDKSAAKALSRLGTHAASDTSVSLADLTGVAGVEREEPQGVAHVPEPEPELLAAADPVLLAAVFAGEAADAASAAVLSATAAAADLELDAICVALPPVQRVAVDHKWQRERVRE
ncbi:uncharacterized protein AMSG_04976 [Thecamonas trahens ATCC 50062]|uniref:Uncharacterized protein n=1 Tax=Thecamonas trahens ATCC 50062 TaxID=461836 RepID=A0A0L0D825_THETB|nr:hypothetical protein AMSG_04976 [Thecamonas trahens ATCC 50062]KNC48532.1 hypothetical protein AMSG_04976 [Thecamonas trahens ATCC 50062]|eukprot:XP_013758640.1 hypothetical protein AMSG_04976 [Thecamonas trahens ATCC 50062]